MVDSLFFTLYWKHVPYNPCTSSTRVLYFSSIFLDWRLGLNWTNPSTKRLKFESPSKWNSCEGSHLEHRIDLNPKLRARFFISLSKQPPAMMETSHFIWTNICRRRHHIIQTHNHVMWGLTLFCKILLVFTPNVRIAAKYCQSHGTLLWIWRMKLWKKKKQWACNNLIFTREERWKC
jgi:hypothetical protein